MAVEPVVSPADCNTLPHPLCRFLRTKKMLYVQDLHQVTLDLVTSGTYQNFWCQHTMTDTGPDDGYVEYERCIPGRSCYDQLEP